MRTTISGGKFFSVENESLLAIGSRDFHQNDIELLSTLENISGILFYFGNFINVDFSVLKNEKISKLSFMHGNFGDENLQTIINLPALRFIKLLDTRVTSQAIDVYKKKHPLILIN
jgi:hypothetical protein